MRKIYRLVPLKIKTRLHKNIKTGPFKNKKYKIQTGFENLRTGYKKYALVPNKKNSTNFKKLAPRYDDSPRPLADRRPTEQCVFFVSGT